MAVISAKTIITSQALFHITLGFFFLVNPITIADQTLVYILGEAVGLPNSRSFESPNPALGFLSIVLIFMGIADLATLSMPEEVSLVHHWGTQAPLRLAIAIASGAYSLSGGDPRYRLPAHPAASPLHVPMAWGGDALKNRVFFSFMFMEVISYSWIWVTLREERERILARKLRKRSLAHYKIQ